MVRIKEFASICDCSIYTLRYYDEIGLLIPQVVDHDSGYRFYKEEQVNEYLEIKQFQEIGFSIKEILNLKNMSHQEIANQIMNKIKDIQKLLDSAYILKNKYLNEVENDESF